MKFMKRLSGGFTLIELLVVMAIIGTLASIVLGSLNLARAKARDASRSASIRQVQNALEMYYQDTGEYPTANDAVLSSISGALVPTYISRLPEDPLASGVPYRYHTLNQDDFYAIRIGYESGDTCYVCGGDPSECNSTSGWWSENLCGTEETG